MRRQKRTISGPVEAGPAEDHLSLRSQPLVHALLQKIEGQCSGTEHFVMKGADIKILTKLILGPLT